ncbi:hypothetical protein AMJ39_03200 [candidate division TA06 bacterium DG_24]|uniref:Dihydrolipoyl dehydrogenase n=3 Tax=Bacteria division TA06 TaxID=1156500 RepID=A0A0S8JIH3_UNCT6|nr:MAG: hypothetical protein AMJ39_03200 [candidate division TA06 bacterium DG_24]KPK70766.1 MAG: hypothetical protein AMJ82_02415 [candidate division TA06 bacterium SM23_40]KPL09505.1 MAG: hypothetical protein AMJ71_06230 [candidate division TA06 bacterium SM1_40]
MPENELPKSTRLLVIGAGPGGYVAAIRAAQLGVETTLVEKEPSPGGICLNHGCIPSKALISAADLVHRSTTAQEMGVLVEGANVDISKLQAWKTDIIRRLTDGVAKLLKGNGVVVVQGVARLTGPRQVEVRTPDGTGEIEFEHAIIATGSRPFEIPGLPFDGERIITSTEALALQEVPPRLLVVGGGYIGLELGTVYAKLGSAVTVVEMLDQLLPGTELRLVQTVARRLKQLAIEVHLRTKAVGVKEEDGRTVLEVEREGTRETIPFDRALITVGRRPNTEDLGLDAAGVLLGDGGFINTDDQMRTSVPHVFAIGDVAGQPLLAHKASREGILAATVIAGQDARVDWRVVPAVVFTDPEIATVGMTDAQAKAQGIETIVGRFPFAALGRALTMAQPDGFVNVVAQKGTEKVLGVHIVGPEAGVLIGEAALAIEMEATIHDIARTIHPHPTLSESLVEAAEGAIGKAIHLLRR